MVSDTFIRVGHHGDFLGTPLGINIMHKRSRYHYLQEHAVSNVKLCFSFSENSLHKLQSPFRDWTFMTGKLSASHCFEFFKLYTHLLWYLSSQVIRQCIQKIQMWLWALQFPVKSILTGIIEESQNLSGWFSKINHHILDQQMNFLY